jgi:hypothetical protein
MNDLGADTWLWNRTQRTVLLSTQESDGGWSQAKDHWGQFYGRLLVTSLSLQALEAQARYVPLPKPPAELTVLKMENLWDDLADREVLRPAQAMRLLAAVPQNTVPFLRKRLRPVPRADTERMARLITDLDSEKFTERHQATNQLEKLGELAAPALGKVLEGKPSLEVRKRVERLLARLDERGAAPDRLQTARAIKVLEYAGTPGAMRVLQRLAEGAPGALATVEAKASLQRLALRPAAKP